MTIGTGLYITHCSEEGLLAEYYLTLTTTFTTGLRTGSRLCTGSVTGFTIFFNGKLYFFFASKYRFLKGYADTGTQIGTLHGSGSGTAATAASTSASKEISEYISEHITEVHTAEVICSASSGTAVKC